jgi:hypothetical protein
MFHLKRCPVSNDAMTCLFWTHTSCSVEAAHGTQPTHSTLCTPPFCLGSPCLPVMAFLFTKKPRAPADLVKTTKEALAKLDGGDAKKNAAVRGSEDGCDAAGGAHACGVCGGARPWTRSPRTCRP